MGWIMFVTNMDGRTIRCSDNCGNTVVCRDTSCLPSTSINVRYRPKALSPVLNRVPGTRTGTLKAPPSLSLSLSPHTWRCSRVRMHVKWTYTHTRTGRGYAGIHRFHSSICTAVLVISILVRRLWDYHPPPPSSTRFRRGYVFYLRLTTLQYSRLRIPFSLFPR